MSNRIAELKSQLAEALQERRAVLVAELANLDRELALLNGKPASKSEGKRRGRPPKAARKRAGRPRKAKTGAFADTGELKSLLSKADGKRLNRKGFNDAGYSLKSAIAIAKVNPSAFGHEQNRA